jgi:hypothetical protein
MNDTIYRENSYPIGLTMKLSAGDRLFQLLNQIFQKETDFRIDENYGGILAFHVKCALTDITFNRLSEFAERYYIISTRHLKLRQEGFHLTVCFVPDGIKEN